MLASRPLAVFLLCAAPGAAVGADLARETVEAYERYIERVERGFALERGAAGPWLEHTSPETRARLRAGEIPAWPGSEDGILDVPGGLIHHWRAAVFLPDATLATVLALAQDYDSYARTYDWIIRSSLLGHVTEREPRRDRFWTVLRIERSASVVTSTVDVWSAVEYRYPRRDLVTAASDADCIRQVDNPGKPDERRLPAGKGSGYLWRANTYTIYLERDEGVYVDLQTVGLSRGFPPLLGWIIEPIARRLGRGSAAESLERLRAVLAQPDEGGRDGRVQPPAGRPSTGWCGEAMPAPHSTSQGLSRCGAPGAPPPLCLLPNASQAPLEFFVVDLSPRISTLQHRLRRVVAA